ncbi:SDR family oxidoreductase [Kribbella sp. NPDC051770]|uniref:SDR family NAD(P)-dependent oxidoreductase n=1 Tax=Kribbella sp. NPDC051770 TaxID=3155413 RepID=UPI00343112A2
MRQLQNKVALITGGTAGIGLATAQRFTEEGATVYITGRRQSELDTAATKSGAIPVQGDVANPADLDRLYAQIRADGHRLDVLVANVGVGDFVRLEDITEDHYDRIFDTNVKATLNTVQKALPLLNDGASIVLVTSIASVTHQEGLSVYSASKAAVRSFARSWARELSPRNIRVNAMSPGSTDTPAVDAALTAAGLTDKSARDAWKTNHVATIPLSRVSQPEEQAAAILFLASPQSTYVTGTELVTDGGTTTGLNL